MKVGVVNFNMGNITSVVNAIEYIGYESVVLNSVKKFDQVSKIILPGVGSFKSGVENLRKIGFLEKIKDEIMNEKPILGICLGMQLLAEIGCENGKSKGFGFIEGVVKKISTDLKLPHVGWNNIELTKDSILFKNLRDLNFYFVHSYAIEKTQYSSSVVEYGGKIVSSVEKDNIFGVQFHPEKSQKSGLQLLRNFVELC